MKKNYIMIIFLILFAAISSCARMIRPNPPTDLTNRPLPIVTPFYTIEPTKDWYYDIPSTAVYHMPIGTPYPDSTAESMWWKIFESLDQTTDGRLSLFVREPNPVCHDLNTAKEIFPLEFAFVNLTANPIKVPTRFAVTRSGTLASDINPFYFSNAGKRIWLSGWQIDDTPSGGEKVAVISGNGVLMITVDVYFPYSLSPGSYYIKIYFNSDFDFIAGQENVWSGLIGSNPIKFCIK